MESVKGLQGKIVTALETGQDPAPLLQALAELRAKNAAEVLADAELAELQKVADERKAVRGKVEAVKVKVGKQGEGIDASLKARDTLVSQLQPLLEPMKELVKMGAVIWEGKPGACYIFNSRSQFQGAVRQVAHPEEYFPQGFGCPFIQIGGGKVDAREKIAEANKYLNDAYGILIELKKGISVFPFRPAEELVAVDNEPESEVEGETAEVESSCLVCQHRNREAIDKALTEGKSLRTLEAEFNVSRSTLHRHKAHVEGLED